MSVCQAEGPQGALHPRDMRINPPEWRLVGGGAWDVLGVIWPLGRGPEAELGGPPSPSPSSHHLPGLKPSD